MSAQRLVSAHVRAKFDELRHPIPKDVGGAVGAPALIVAQFAGLDEATARGLAGVMDELAVPPAMRRAAGCADLLDALD